MKPAEALRYAERIIQQQAAEIARLRSSAETMRWLLEARREERERERQRPLRVVFGPSPTFTSQSPEFPERATEASRRRQARGGIGP